MDSPIERSAGVSTSRERKWGLIGGLVGTVVGVGSAAVAVGIDGASFTETGLYPRIFRSQEVLALDVYMLAVLIAGVSFSAAALFLARRSFYPRTECYGAGLLGLILSALGGVLLFIRLLALVAR
ncbi:MAG TPA: hypothetical protein VIE88_12280 [Vicinamibacteria bacterium]|jgi:hypothetical protein